MHFVRLWYAYLTSSAISLLLSHFTLLSPPNFSIRKLLSLLLTSPSKELVKEVSKDAFYDFILSIGINRALETMFVSAGMSAHAWHIISWLNFTLRSVCWCIVGNTTKQSPCTISARRRWRGISTSSSASSRSTLLATRMRRHSRHSVRLWSISWLRFTRVRVRRRAWVHSRVQWFQQVRQLGRQWEL